MKKIFLSVTLLVSVISFAQSGCCNVVDSEGLPVISSNGSCVVAEGLASAGDCNKEKVNDEVVKKVVKKAVKTELENSEKDVLIKAFGFEFSEFHLSFFCKIASKVSSYLTYEQSYCNLNESLQLRKDS